MKTRYTFILFLVVVLLLFFFWPAIAKWRGSLSGTPSAAQPTSNVTVVVATQPPQQQPTQTPTPTAIPIQQPQTISVVRTADQPCPTNDFSFESGIGKCNFGGGKTLVCEGDLSDSLGAHPDSVADTGQVDVIDQAATIDGSANGGTCHYSPPWTVDKSVTSVKKNGCGHGCVSVQVFKDGSQSQTL